MSGIDLPVLWFILIAVLFAGYFLLEGFDFGVGILLPFLGRNEARRSAMIRTIGPVWDGNEVWLITAGGALFAAFPERSRPPDVRCRLRRARHPGRCSGR